MVLRTIAAGLCALMLAVAPAHAQDRALLQLDWIPTGEHAAYFAGATRGFWREQGIELSLTRGYGSGDTVNKLAAGAAQFGVADLGAVLAARARQNVPVRAVSAIYTHSPHSLFVLRSRGITDFRGLEGRRIAVTPGNSHRLYFPEVARRAGTNPDRITWVNTDASAMAALLISKRVDAAPFYSIHHYYTNKAALAAGEEIVVLPFVETGFAIYAASIAVTDEMIQKNPDLVRRFLVGLQRSLEWSRDNQAEACKLHVARNPEVAQDDCEGSLRAVMSFVFTDHARETGLGRFQPERLATTWKVVAESLQLDPNWDPAGAINTSLLP
ncbi:ABC transporter substrate-binding protein [Belnapia rosea]|uniref:NitT/TauT family transport system substrate-binding protein n=1 Tax=Belnapia rosea TaxID=938405 RepID=A0A1G6NFU6_9PROT|nr:ABC transporter substrate-binding protein [Belnapia rosea]SDB66992.1 NitT/TauT family transport system substrate-binding protein [Belnapia rosea]SDC66581.1 NitT/TauT family transport system substrate-binding protein [Belnapia rosea]